MPTIVKAVRAQVGETVEIHWRNDDGVILVVRYAAPPAEVWVAAQKT